MRIQTLIATLTFLFLASANASATYLADFSYDYSRTGNHFTFNVTASNTSTGSDTAPLDMFIINLDADSSGSPAYSHYANIAWLNDNGLETDLSQPKADFGGVAGNVLAFFPDLGTGIAQGSSVGNFSFTFDYSGDLTPDQQFFSWYATFGTNLNQSGIPFGNPDSPDYWIAGDATGNGVYSGNPAAPVPEPSSMALIAVGVGMVALVRRRKA